MQYTNIVHETPKMIKQMARQMLKDKWLQAFVFMLLITLIMNAPALILMKVDYGYFIGYMIDAYNVFIRGPLQLSMAYYFLRVFRSESVGNNLVKYGFDNGGKAISLYISIWVRTTLGFICFIIPGLIASLKYSMAFFILAENPEKTPRECLAESALRMNGNKMNLFKLVLSFLPLIIICAAPKAIVMNWANPGNIETYTMLIKTMDASYYSQLTNNMPYLAFIASLTSLIYELYLWTAQAGFYDLLTGGLVVTGNE